MDSTRLHCFFCTRPLRKGTGRDRWVCSGCNANFLAEVDLYGCIVGLKVLGCGAEECCRNEEVGGISPD